MSDKTEKASPKKKRDERKKGNVFQSKDVVTLINIITAFYALYLSLNIIYRVTSTFYIRYMALIGTTQSVNETTVVTVFKDIFIALITSTGVMIISIGFVSILTTAIQTRFIFSKETIKFKLENISPLKGIKKIFSLKSLVEVAKSILKIIVLGYFIYNTVQDNILYANKLVNLDLLSGIRFITDTVLDMVKDILVAFIAIAGIDFMFSLFQYNKNMMMSKQEVKEEYKEMEGDPHVKGQRKQIQRQMSMNRMMTEVPTADVVIRNPTHFAVAIKYNIDKDNAPIVIAKGQDNVALKIVEIAELNGINTVENIPLARALYKDAEVNKMIPEEYFEPVAEVLAWVYSLQNKK